MKLSFFLFFSFGAGWFLRGWRERIFSHRRDVFLAELESKLMKMKFEALK